MTTDNYQEYYNYLVNCESGEDTLLYTDIPLTTFVSIFPTNIQNVDSSLKGQFSIAISDKYNVFNVEYLLDPNNYESKYYEELQYDNMVNLLKECQERNIQFFMQ